MCIYVQISPPPARSGNLWWRTLWHLNGYQLFGYIVICQGHFLATFECTQSINDLIDYRMSIRRRGKMSPGIHVTLHSIWIMTLGSFQYPIRRLIVRSRKVSDLRNWVSIYGYCSEIWHAAQQHCCCEVCQILQQLDICKGRSRVLEISRDLQNDVLWDIETSSPQSKLGLCSANHRPGYWSNLSCDWLSTAWAYSEQETENGPWIGRCEFSSSYVRAPSYENIT